MPQSGDFNHPFVEAVDYLRRKVAVPTTTWRDIEGRSHDRSFVVAGAKKRDLLEDIRAEMVQAVSGKLTLAEWSRDFEAIVARHGWTGWTGEGTARGHAWRTRLIYDTNLRTAYAAGRYRQMTDPDVVKIYKWWRYRHHWTRVPLRERPEHAHVFNGTLLPWDHVWWKTHYPPNGWNCSCGVEPLSDRDLRGQGLTASPDPVSNTRLMRDPKTGDMVKVPVGIDLGWDHAPGRDWSLGIVPRALQVPLDPPETDAPRLALQRALPPLAEIAKPFVSARLPDDVKPEEAVKAFLEYFGATWDEPRMVRDQAGHAIPIAKSLFLRGDGKFKGGSRDRHLHMPQLAETIADPDEIWLEWVQRRDTGRWVLARRYLRVTPDGAGFGAFTWTDDGWEGSTAFPPEHGVKGAVNPGYIERHRRGALLYRRAKK